MKCAPEATDRRLSATRARYRVRMGGREFRAAGVVAILMAACALLVAWNFHLPVRDPDGASLPTWFRLPAIVGVGDRA